MAQGCLSIGRPSEAYGWNGKSCAILLYMQVPLPVWINIGKAAFLIKFLKFTVPVRVHFCEAFLFYNLAILGTYRKRPKQQRNTVSVIVFILYDQALQTTELIDAVVGIGLARTKGR